MAYGYRDRLRNGNNSNILCDNISFDLSETANVFIEPIKSSSILARARIFLFYAFIELSNREIERDFYIVQHCHF